MIATLTGTLADRSGETIVIQTAAGVGYAVTVPLGVLERLPPAGARCSLFTELVVREDGWTLYGFDRATDRGIFQRLLTASGFGPRLALALLSTLGPERTVRSIQSRDIAALGIGRKKAERLVLELQDRFTEITPEPAPVRSSTSEDAVRALTALGYTQTLAEEAVRDALAGGGETTEEPAALIRRALQLVTAGKRGRV